MHHFACLLFLVFGIIFTPVTNAFCQDTPLFVGFGAKDVTPDWQKRTVYLAGFGQNRKADGVLDPIMARAIVLRNGKEKIALVSVDLVGVFFENVQSIRKKLPDFRYVLVSATHNHEGPDTVGIWGPNLFSSGVDQVYMQKVESGIVAAIQAADGNTEPVIAEIGSAKAPELLHDSREPYVKHDELVALRFRNVRTKKLTGQVVQWNCHPETLGSKNTKISTDFVGYTVSYLQKKYQCPTIYFTGTVGGLMTSLRLQVKDANGNLLKDGTVAKTKQYGRLVGKLAERALTKTKRLKLTPIQVRTRTLYLPLDNQLYKAGWGLGVLKRKAFLWNGSANRAKPITKKVAPKTRLAIQTEIGWLQLGDLSIAAIPGEIYPELVLGKIQDPVDRGADFPKAGKEPAIYSQMPGPFRMLLGLANDEVGYIIPKRQWDVIAPYCYGRKRKQYGEDNSVGPETAPILCEMFRALTRTQK